MTFDLSDVQRAWRGKGSALGRDARADASAPAVIAAAARLGLLGGDADLLALALAVEAAAAESPAAGMTLALHAGTARALAGDDRFRGLFDGSAVAAAGLSSDETPVEEDGRLSGRAPWVAPIGAPGVAVVAPPRDPERLAYAVSLDAPGVTVEILETSALDGLACGTVSFSAVPCAPAGGTLPIMARVRLLIAAAGLGMGGRALAQALDAARAAHSAAAGEQTVQGLLADSATELDAARLMTWRAATADPISLASASHAKLMATAAAQRAVERATQVVGAESFRRGHPIEQLARDVRALELFAGRTEALRAAVAEELLPRG